MLHNIYRENAVNCVLKRRLTAVGPFSRNKSHIVFQIFQKCFQNVKLFSINPIKILMFMQLDSEFHKNCFDLLLTVNSMSITNAEKYWNTLKFLLFGQSTEQTLSNFELWKSWSTSNFESWGLTLVAYKKVYGWYQ